MEEIMLFGTVSGVKTAQQKKDGKTFASFLLSTQYNVYEIIVGADKLEEIGVQNIKNEQYLIKCKLYGKMQETKDGKGTFNSLSLFLSTMTKV